MLVDQISTGNDFAELHPPRVPFRVTCIEAKKHGVLKKESRVIHLILATARSNIFVIGDGAGPNERPHSALGYRPQGQVAARSAIAPQLTG